MVNKTAVTMRLYSLVDLLPVAHWQNQQVASLLKHVLQVDLVPVQIALVLIQIVLGLMVLLIQLQYYSAAQPVKEAAFENAAHIL